VLNREIKRYIEIALDAALAGAAYAWWGWIGVAVIGFVVFSRYFFLIIENQQATVNALKAVYSRLPDRCAFCHRENCR
jgi:formate-dependent nitrite reductase membrane component NrfD